MKIKVLALALGVMCGGLVHAQSAELDQEKVTFSQEELQEIRRNLLSLRVMLAVVDNIDNTTVFFAKMSALEKYAGCGKKEVSDIITYVEPRLGDVIDFVNEHKEEIRADVKALFFKYANKFQDRYGKFEAAPAADLVEQPALSSTATLQEELKAQPVAADEQDDLT